MKNTLLAKKTLTALVVAVLVISIFTFATPVAAQDTDKGIIVFDYSHGQHSNYVEYLDEYLDGNLTAMGYEVVWATGGLNDSILADAEGLILGCADNEIFTTAEVTAVADWFNAGNKFLWVSGDSDFAGPAPNNNMTLILEAVNSHVYLEPTAVEDTVSNCGSGYRPVANTTSDDAFVADMVAGVDKVLMHGPTLLYGSNAATGAADATPVALETTDIADVYPVLYYGAGAVITDADDVEPIAHDDNDVGAFVAVTYEANAGDANTGAIVVSGASPYGDYQPMFADAYYDVELDGHTFVKQVIDFGMAQTVPGLDIVMILLIVGVAAVVIIIIIVLMKKR